MDAFADFPHKRGANRKITSSKLDEQSVSTGLFSEQEKQKKQPMFGHLAEMQPAGVVFFCPGAGMSTYDKASNSG